MEWRNGNIWLGDGFDRFREAYNIQVLDTLYFRHKFKDHFTVVMYNAAGMQYGWERDAPNELPVSFVKHIVSRDYATKLVCPFYKRTFDITT